MMWGLSHDSPACFYFNLDSSVLCWIHHVPRMCRTGLRYIQEQLGVMGQPPQSVIYLNNMVMGKTALWLHCIHLQNPGQRKAVVSGRLHQKPCFCINEPQTSIFNRNTCTQTRRDRLEECACRCHWCTVLCLWWVSILPAHWLYMKCQWWSGHLAGDGQPRSPCRTETRPHPRTWGSADCCFEVRLEWNVVCNVKTTFTSKQGFFLSVHAMEPATMSICGQVKVEPLKNIFCSFIKKISTMILCVNV